MLSFEIETPGPTFTARVVNPWFSLSPCKQKINEEAKSRPLDCQFSPDFIPFIQFILQLDLSNQSGSWAVSFNRDITTLPENRVYINMSLTFEQSKFSCK